MLPSYDRKLTVPVLVLLLSVAAAGPTLAQTGHARGVPGRARSKRVRYRSRSDRRDRGDPGDPGCRAGC